MKKKEAYVTVIGGVNIDVIGIPNNDLILQDSNPGIVKIALGGVGRNIAENLVKLGVDTKLISAIGDDIYGQKVLNEARLQGINMQDSLILKRHPTSIYLAVLDENRDMKVAISHMDIVDKLDIDFIKNKNSLIKKTQVCVIDTNIPKDVIEYVLVNNKETDFFLDTVSTIKSLKIKDLIGYFHTIKPNKIEAEMLSGIKINSEKDLETCAEYFLNKGVKRTFISLGAKGVYYSDGVNKKHLFAHEVSLVNSTGAGDAFMAALVYCFNKGYDIDYSARFAMAASGLTLTHEDTINPNMSVKNVINFMDNKEVL